VTLARHWFGDLPHREGREKVMKRFLEVVFDLSNSPSRVSLQSVAAMYQ